MIDENGRSRLHGEIPSAMDPAMFLGRDVRLQSRTITTSVALTRPFHDSWQQHSEFVRDVIKHAAGTRPRDWATTPVVRETARSKREGYSVVSLDVEIVEGFSARAELLVPFGASSAAAVLHPQGHWPMGRAEISDSSSLSTACINLVMRGYVVLSYDMVGYGHTLEVGHGFLSADYEARQLGMSLFGLQHHIGLACLSYLSELPFVDSTRIACVGASGGGTQVLALAAADDRIAVAIPVNIISGNNQGWCLCENPPSLRTLIHNLDLAAAIAPRPLLVISATGDWTLTTPSVEWPQIQKVYADLGVAKRTAQLQFDAGHNYNRDSRQAVYRWLDRWLMLEGADDDYLEVPIPRGPEQYELPANLPESRESLVAGRWRKASGEQAKKMLRGGPEPSSQAILRTLDLDLGLPRARTVSETFIGDTETSGVAAYDGCAFHYRAFGSGKSGHAVVLVVDTVPEGDQWDRFKQAVVETHDRLFVISPFLTSMWRSGQGRLGRSHEGPFPLTYNRHDSVEQIRDVVAALGWIRASQSIKELSLLAPGDLGPGALVAASVSGSFRAVAVDLVGFRCIEGVPFSSKLDCAGLALAGGMDAVITALDATSCFLGSVSEESQDAFSKFTTSSPMFDTAPLNFSVLQTRLWESRQSARKTST